MDLALVISGVLIGWMILISLFDLIRNMSQPLRVREARIAGKRQCQDSFGGLSGVPSTRYYITFEFPESSPKVFSVNYSQYRLLAKGDQGTLHSQGDWHKGFERRRQA